MENARIILAGGETHRVNSIRVLLEGTGHRIVEIARTRSSAIHALGNVGASGANLLLLDADMEPEPESNDAGGPEVDAQAIMAATLRSRPAAHSSIGEMDVIAISHYPITEYGVREGVTKDIGRGGVPYLPEVIDGL